MTRQTKNSPITGYSHYSRKEVFRQLGLTITDKKPEIPTVAPVKAPEPEPVTEEEEVIPEPVVIAPEPVVEEAQEQLNHDEETVISEVSETPEVVITSLEVLELRKAHAKALESNGIASVEDLAAYLETGKSLSDLSNLSAAAVKSINEKFEQWQKEQNQTK